MHQGISFRESVKGAVVVRAVGEDHWPSVRMMPRLERDALTKSLRAEYGDDGA